MKKKILFVTGSMGKGGAEKVISNLSKFYANENWEVNIAMLLHNKVEYKLPSNINIINLSSDRGIKKDFFVVIRRIRKYIQESNPDVIVCFMAQNILLTGLATIKIDVPLIVSERIDPSSVKRNIIFKCVLNKIYEKSSKVVFQTKRAQAFFNKKIQKNSCIIRNPISITKERSKYIKHEIVTIGRLTEQKNQKLLIEAFKEINSKYPEYKLKIYGEGILREKLEKQIKDLKLEKKIFLLGTSDDIHKEISNSEIFVLSSNFEGLSNALMEAMLMGFPVISTNCAGSDEILINNQNGILIHTENKEELINSLEKLILNKKIREKLGREAKKSVETYKTENIISKWANLVDDVINNKRTKCNGDKV